MPNPDVSPGFAALVREAQRRQLIARMTRTRAEIAQMFRDVAHWNKHVRPDGCPPIDPDPCGQMARLDEWLVDQIGKLS